MKRGPLPPTPSLADAAVARIERGLFAALDARPLAPGRPWVSRRRGLAFALAGVAAATALFAAREGRRGDALPARAQLSTAQLSTAQLNTAQLNTTTSGSRIAIAGATLDVAPQSAISFGGGRDGAVVVVLDRGTVTCEVAPRSKRAPFIVEAGATRVTVIGTRFSVHRVGEHATVSVDHGLVEVADTNMTELVHAGERYAPGEAVTREPVASVTPGPAAVASAAPFTTPAAATARAPTPAPEDPISATRRRRQRQLALADAEVRAPAPAPTATHDGAPAAAARSQDIALADRPAASALADPSTAKPRGTRRSARSAARCRSCSSWPRSSRSAIPRPRCAFTASSRPVRTAGPRAPCSLRRGSRVSAARPSSRASTARPISADFHAAPTPTTPARCSRRRADRPCARPQTSSALRRSPDEPARGRSRSWSSRAGKGARNLSGSSSARTTPRSPPPCRSPSHHGGCPCSSCPAP